MPIINKKYLDLTKSNTKVEIDLKQYKKNIKDVIKLAPNSKLMVIVKANGYGLGAIELAKTALENGASYLGVARVSEAIELRQNKITDPILLLSEPKPEDIKHILENNITQTIYTKSFATKLNNFNKKIKVHIKIDSGMGRLGITIDKINDFFIYISTLNNIEIEGIFTQFPCSDNTSSKHTQQQLNTFNTQISTLAKLGIKAPIIHAANSAGIFNYPKSHLNMVRFGIDSYTNIITIKSYITQVKQLPAGSKISYNSTHTLNKESYVAIICCGYADGIPVALSNKGQVIINSKKYPIIGRVCMDMTIVNLGNNPDNIAEGATAIFCGKQNQEEITIHDICKLTNRISYEILCGIGPRVQRVYIS
jgi:alanine racemase